VFHTKGERTLRLF